MTPRRRWLQAALGALTALGISRGRSALAAPAELRLPDDAPVQTFDFESRGIEDWTTVTGQWAVEEMAGAPSGKRVLVQRATQNEFNVIVAPPVHTDVDVPM